MCEIYELVNEMKDSRIFMSFSSRLLIKRDVLHNIIRHVNVLVTSPNAIEEDLKIAGMCGKDIIKEILEEARKSKDEKIVLVGEKIMMSPSHLLYLMGKKIEAKIRDENIIDKFNSKNKSINLKKKSGKLINEAKDGIKKQNEVDSILSICYRNKVLLFCPLLTETNPFDILSFPLILDAVEDIYLINTYGMKSKNTSGLVFSTGIYKHHILNANLFKEGLDRCLIVNSAVEYDGTDSGATVEEAVTWGKIKPKTKSIKIHGEAANVIEKVWSCMIEW